MDRRGRMNDPSRPEMPGWREGGWDTFFGIIADQRVPAGEGASVSAETYENVSVPGTHPQTLLGISTERSESEPTVAVRGRVFS